MPQYPVELSQVIYDPTARAFEAMVHVHDPQSPATYPCRISATLACGFSRTARELTRQALCRHRQRLSKGHWPSRGTRSPLGQRPSSARSKRAASVHQAG